MGLRLPIAIAAASLILIPAIAFAVETHPNKTVPESTNQFQSQSFQSMSASVGPADGATQAKVNVNGQDISVPDGNGSVHRVINSDTGITTIDINVQDNNSSGFSSSSVNVSSHSHQQINSQSH